MDAVHALFQGAEVPPDVRETITKNYEALMARSSLAAATMTMDADVVLVAAAADGVTEERIRASSTVLVRVSSGFRGVLEESPGEIKLWRPGPARILHPIAAVRFVMAVVHAVEAHGETPATGLDVGAPPPLDVLLSACQIADCWDCPPVLAAAARCVEKAAAAEGERKRVSSVLTKMLRLAHSVDESTVAGSSLRAAIEKTIARRVPIDWLPSMLKSFDLESACRVINEVEDLEVELVPVVLRGPSMLEKGWWHHPSGDEDCHNRVKGEPSPWANAGDGSRKSAERRNGSFAISVSTCSPDVSEVEAEEDNLRRLNDVIVQHPELTDQGAALSAVARATETLRLAKLRSVRCDADVHGPIVVLAPGSCLWIKPDDPAQETITRYIVNRHEPPEAFHGGGWEWAKAEKLGGFQAGGTLVISKLQRQFQVLHGWQRLTGARRAPGPCPIVGTLERLLTDSSIVQPRVRLAFPYVGGFNDYVGRQMPTPACLTIEAQRAEEPPEGAKAAAILAASMTELVICRLDDKNGPVNRATASLDQSTMLQILAQTSYPGIIAPTTEKALLRIAVDWSSRPGRSSEAIEAVMSRIHFAGVPTVTLMHLDEGSGWDKCGLPQNHTLGEQLIKLSSKPFVHKLMIEALEAQRKGHTGAAALEVSGELRPCFSEPQKFPTGEGLYAIGQRAMGKIQMLKSRAERAEKDLKQANEKVDLLLDTIEKDRKDEPVQKRAMESAPESACKRLKQVES